MTKHLNKYCNLIFEMFARQGYKIYTVGGCVRDSLLNIAPKDIDFCTDATVEEMEYVAELIYEQWPVKIIPTGREFGTLTFYFNDDCQYEVTTFRGEGRYSDSRHPDSVTFVKDLKEDLLRRDFTCNAIAWNPEKGYVDPFNGMEDINRGIIRCVGNPNERFEEDALRIMRLARFALKYGFEVEKNTLDAAISNVGKLSKISKERIGKELMQIFKYDITQCDGSFQHLLDWIFFGVHQNWNIVYDLRHTHNYLLRWYKLFNKNSFNIKERLSKYAVSTEISTGVANINKAINYVHEVNRSKIKSIRCLGMLSTTDERLAFLEYIRNFDTDLYIWLFDAWVQNKPCRLEDLTVDGKVIMKELNLQPSSLVGEVLDHCLEAVFAHPDKNNKQFLLNAAKEYLADLEND